MGLEVKAKWPYNSGHKDDLSFNAGQVIAVVEEVDDEWYSGEYTDSQGHVYRGIFPRNFVSVVSTGTPLTGSTPTSYPQENLKLTGESGSPEPFLEDPGSGRLSNIAPDVSKAGAATASSKPSKTGVVSEPSTEPRAKGGGPSKRASFSPQPVSFS
jgi:myosin tail region-interacting protein MTI1